MKELAFTKMQGLGNDYIYIDARDITVEDPAALSRRLSDRHFGIGGDGIVLIGRSDVADFSMRMFNADGSEGLMCGNAARCIGKYVYDKGLTSKQTVTLETSSGIKTLVLHPSDGTVSVDMGRFASMPAPSSMSGFQGTGINMGNPHYVMFVPDAEAVDLPAAGPAIETDDAFPGGVNAEFASVRRDGSIRMRVWERGSGITLACGTGACATAAAAVLAGIKSYGEAVRIVMDGGSLSVTVESDGRVSMTGPAVTVFEGRLNLA
ncbi:MAG: diaminopimelate epimerase [Bacteroidales bacterium]|nr:diaminopimelate epimerase [Bacteroidales bacterium]